MFKVDMKAFKTAMKLIAELPTQQPVNLNIHLNGVEWTTSNGTWRLVVPVECESEIEGTTIKFTHEVFMDLFKKLRAVKKDIKVALDKTSLDITVSQADDAIASVKATAITDKPLRTVPNESVSQFKIDDMLSFLNSVYAFKSNKFTPIDKRVEVHLGKDVVRMIHFTHIKMTEMTMKSSSREETESFIIDTSELAAVYSLFKNSMEFDGEIQANNNVIIFATHRFKIGFKKEHQSLTSYDSLFNQEVISHFKFSESLLRDLYVTKKNSTPLQQINLDGKTIQLSEQKANPSKDDIMVRITSSESGTLIEPYLYKSTSEIGEVADGRASFYDLSTLYKMAYAFVEPGFTASILSNHVIRLENSSKNVMGHLLPILPARKIDTDEENLD